MINENISMKAVISNTNGCFLMKSSIFRKSIIAWENIPLGMLAVLNRRLS